MPKQLPRVSSTVGPSADASAISRVTEIPVNYYTGIPQVEYPVFSFSNGALNLSVALNYFAGGIKVEELATHMGLGWSLNAGGAIVRTVRGIPDDYPVKGFMYTTTIPSSPGTLIDSFYQDKMDAQLDIFQFNFNGRSGKFYMGKNNKILITPDTKIKIEPITGAMPDAPASTLKAFTITTEDGSSYYFTERELSKIDGVGETSLYINKNYVSAWYLSKIVAPFRTDSIQFTYDLYTTRYTSRSPEVTVTDPGKNNKVIQNINKYVEVYLQGRKIRRIDLPDNTYLNFIYESKDRCDAIMEYALRKIELNGSKLRKGVRLDYMYSTPNGFVSYNQPCTGLPKDNRLFLQQITNYTDGGEAPPTIYEYEKDVMLPSRDSKALDFWGYFNGKDNTTLVPPYASMTYGGDRNPDFHFMKAGSLRKIIQPGGGYVQLDYENNEHFTMTSENKVVTPIYQNSGVQQLITVNKLFTSQAVFNFKFQNATSNNYFQSHLSASITVKILDESKTNVVFENEIRARDMAIRAVDLTANLPYNGGFWLQINFNNFVPADIPYILTSFSWTNEVVLNDRKPVGGLRIKRQLMSDGISKDKLSVAEYRYVNEAGKSSGYNTAAPIYFYSTGVTVEANNTFYPADVRMSEPLNGLIYTQGSPSGYARVEVINGTTEKNNGKTVYEFSSMKDLMKGGNLTWFYTDYTDIEQYPYPPKEKADWVLGVPQVVSSYGPDGRIVKKRINYFSMPNSFTSDDDFKSLKIGVNREILKNDDVRTNVYATKAFYPLFGYTQLVNTTEIDYFDDGTSTVNVKKYEYDNNLALKRTTVDYDRSRSLQLEKVYYYPGDYTLAGGIGELRKAGVLTPVAVETWLKSSTESRLFSAEATDYSLFGSVPRPSKAYAFSGKQPLDYTQVPAFNPALLNRIPTYMKEVIAYDAYNSKGNLVQVRDLQTGAIASIIYDDQMQVELAKAVNATISEIAYTGFETDTKGQWTYAGVPKLNTDAVAGGRDYLLSTGAITKAALPTGKKYYLSFWTKSGTASVSGGTIDFSQLNAATGWTYYRYKVNGGVAISISGTARIDELRIHPEYATMGSSSYDIATSQQTTVNDENNKFTYYEYDELNRLKTIKDQDRNIVRYNEYTNVQPAFKNTLQSKAFNRICTDGEGSAVTYTVAAGKYTSYTSTEDANEKALQEIQMNGQNNANATGGCTYYNDAISVGFTKTGCAAGTTGSLVYYNVAAQKYSSTISKADANAKANLEATTNGQANANSTGTCIPNVLYVKFFVQNRNTTVTDIMSEYTILTTVDLVVRFFTDAACTIPYSVSNYNIGVNVNKIIDSNINGVPSYSNTNATTNYECNGSVVTLASGIIERQDITYTYEGSGPGDPPYTDHFLMTNTYTLKPDSRYIIK